MKKLGILLLFALLFSVLVGCGNKEKAPSSDSQLVEYGVAGYITEIIPSDREDILGTIRVEGSKDNGAQYDKAVVTVTANTKIYNNDKSDFASLEVGMYVNVFFEGPVKESYPVQADAKQINVIPKDK